MLFLNRGKTLKHIEDGLRWAAGGTGVIPADAGHWFEGVFVQVPELYGQEQTIHYVRALHAEARHVLGGAALEWVQLQGPGVATLAIDGTRAILQAVSPSADAAAGLDIQPSQLEPGAIAGWRSAGVERFNFRLDGPFAGIDEPVRRARALGAFVSVEVCFGGELAGRAFLQAVERAIAASPNQISVSDERSRGAFGAEFMERAGELCAAAGYRRVSLWAWAQGNNSFDGTGSMLSGRAAAIGPGAVCGRPVAYANPGVLQWLETRLDGRFEAMMAGSGLEHWLALAAGLYRLELRRTDLDCRLYRHAVALERLGVVDRLGRPAGGPSMEFCHRVVRAARLALSCSAERAAVADVLPGKAAASGRRRG